MQYVDVFCVKLYNSSLLSFVPNFWILSRVVAEKSLTENLHMYFIGVTGGNIENLKKKESQMRISILIFINTIHFAYMKVYPLKNTGSNRSREICDRNFHWRERKMNK